jgi:hypothetical protein
MAAARYWRLVAIETRGYRADLRLAECALYEGATRVDTVPTASIAPTSGALAALADGTTAASVVWAGADVAMPGFAITWDLGTARAVDQLQATPDTSSLGFIYSAILQRSADGAAWVNEIEMLGLTYPGDLTPAVIIPGDLGYASTGLLLNFDGPNGSTAIVDSSPFALSPTVSTGVSISTAQSKFGGSSGTAAAAGALTFDLSAEFPLGGNWIDGDWTQEFFIRFTSFPSAQVGSLVFMRGGALNYCSISPEGYLYVVTSNESAVFFPSIAVWHHVAVVQASGVPKMFFDGVDSGISFSGGLTQLADYLGVFQYDTTPSVYAPFSTGHIDAVRLSKTARYLSDFTPPSAPFYANMPHAQSLRQIAIGAQQPAAIGYQTPGYTTTRVRGADTATRRDMQYFGAGQIVGTVKEKNTPANTPLVRRVRLVHERTGNLVRETWSDAAGNYAFTELDTSAAYTVLSYDHLHNYRAVIADNLTPEPMP